MSKHIINRLGLAALAAALTLGAGVESARAAVVTPLNLQKPPLFLNSSVDPNIAVTFDDSGSMTSAFMPDNVDDCANNATQLGYRHPRYYSHVYNRIYFNPAITYSPPLQKDGTPFPQPSFTAAPADGFEYNTAIVTGGAGSPLHNLSTKYFPTRTKNARSNDDGTRITNRTETTGTPAHAVGGPKYVGAGAVLNCNGTYGDNTTAWLPFATGTGTGGTSKAFYYRFTGTDPRDAAQVNNAANYVAVDVTAESAAVQQNFANWYSFYRTRTLLGRTAMTRVFGVQGNNLRVAFQNLNTSTYRFANGTTKWEKFVDVSATVKPRTNFFQWLYREDASGSTPLRASALRVGEAFKYGSSTITNSFNPYYEPAPVARELTCRQNFSITLTDGFWNESAPGYSGINDQTNRTLPDGTAYTKQAPYGNEPTTSDNPTLADITFNYWATDLRTDLANNVPKFIQEPNATASVQFFDPDNDPATWQHVVQYIVGLGVAGTRNFPGDLPALEANTLQWPAPTNNSPSAVDDAWHASINSRGEYFSAADPDELVDSLNNVLQSVLIRQGTASAATVTSGIIQASTLAFRTAFDSSDWSGQVVGYKVDEGGRRIEPPIWDAGAALNARTAERQILTSSGPTGGGIPFRWASLPTAYQTKLQDNPATVAVDNDGLGQDRLAWLRGDQSQERPAGPFRVRTKKLGAIVNSGAVVIAGPAAAYTDRWPEGSPELGSGAQLYSAFRATYKNRQRVVYVGANDGMLHAFDAGTGVTTFDSDGNPIIDAGSGDELWAYVPYEVAGNLSQLTNPDYQFTPYVDNTPTARDVFYGGRWHTVVVGALRRGGQGIFALDVTNPGVTESLASSTVLWEFSDDVAVGAGSDPKQLGYTYGKPNISRLANGKWVVVLPASYNSDETGDGAVGTGLSTLFILDIQTGAVLRQFNLTGSKGLTSPTMGDLQGDFVDEYAVAGDLNGQLWKFDLTSTTPSSWTVAKVFQPAVDGDQPITSAPRLFPDPTTADLIAVFGTGKYLEPVDRGNSIPQQRLYGLRLGYPGVTLTLADLQQQTLTKDASNRFRITSNAIPANKKGWFINLLDAGERDVTSAGALFAQGVSIFSTIIPNGNDPCAPSLRGNIYLIDATTGGMPSMGAIVDTNNDGAVDRLDDATVIGTAVSEAVAEGSPALLIAQGGGSGCLVDYCDIKPPVTVWRRRSWREIPNE